MPRIGNTKKSALKKPAEIYTRSQNERLRVSDLDGLDKDASRWLKDTFGAEEFEEGIRDRIQL